ncbi:hypothetical protein ACFXTN_007356 [Malus domestica]
MSQKSTLFFFFARKPRRCIICMEEGHDFVEESLSCFCMEEEGHGVMSCPLTSFYPPETVVSDLAEIVAKSTAHYHVAKMHTILFSDDDDQSGITVVVYIYENKYYFVSDSRISTVGFDEDKKIKTFVFLLNDLSFHLLLINNMFHRVTLDSDVYDKFTKFGTDVYAILFGAKNVMEKFFR